MPDIRMNLKINIEGGQSFSIDHTEAAEAYDGIDVVINHGAVNKVVQLQPGESSQITLLVIQSSLYGPEITFKANDGEANDSDAEVALTAQQIYAKGAADLFGVPVRALKFSNTNVAVDKDARIRIFVARDATP